MQKIKMIWHVILGISRNNMQKIKMIWQVILPHVTSSKLILSFNSFQIF